MGDFLLPRLMTPEGNRGTIPKWPSFKWANLCIQQMLHENHHFTWFWMVNSHDIHILADYSSVWWTIEASVYVAQWSRTVEFRWILPILMAWYSSKRRVYEHFFWVSSIDKKTNWLSIDISGFSTPAEDHGLGVTGILLASALQIGRHRGVAGWRSWGHGQNLRETWPPQNHMQFWWWFTRKR